MGKGLIEFRHLTALSISRCVILSVRSNSYNQAGVGLDHVALNGVWE